MTSRAQHRRHPDAAIFVALLALVAWLPLSWGSNHAGGIAIFGASCALLTAAWAVLWLRGRVRPPQLDALPAAALALWLVWILWVALQLVPLPEGLLQGIAPESAAVHAAVGDNALNTISIAPGRTLEQLMLSVAYLLFFWLALCTLRHNGRIRWFLGVVLVSAAAQAFYGASMTLSGMEYGFFRPKEHGIGWATGTFVNRNHFASYLHLGLAAGLGLLLAWAPAQAARDWREIARRVINTAFSPKMAVRVALAVMAIGLVLSQSRMGNVAFFTALVACGTIWLLLRNRRWLGKGLILFLSVLVIDVWIVSNWFGLDAVVERIEQTDLVREQRTTVLEDIRPLVRSTLVTGTGLGSFEHAYSPYRNEHIRGRFNHAHNEPAQFLVETGAAGLALLAGMVMLLFLHGLRVLRCRNDGTVAAAGFVGVMALTSLLMHSTVEFNLRIPAIAATFLAMLGVLAGTSSRSRRQRRSAHSQAAPTGLHSGT